jgi:phage gp29-like protein
MRYIAGRQRSSRTLAQPSGPSQAYSLEKKLFGEELPRSEVSRRFYGKGLDMDQIDRSLRSAAGGSMVSVTDLGREALMLDGHLSGLVQKRFNRSAAINWACSANDGIGQSGFDQSRAKAYAEFATRQLRRITDFRDRLTDLQWGVWDNRALLEIEWEVVSGREVGDSSLSVGWRVKDLHWIHPRRLSFTQDRDMVVVSTQGAGGGLQSGTAQGFLPSSVPEKFIRYTPRLFSDYAEREGLLMRALYWSYFQRAGTRERLSLMELFASPWRLAFSTGDKPANEDSIKDAFRVLQRMSGRNAAWLPPGVQAQIVQPTAGSGVVQKEIIEDARFVLSKLILGSTGSTDAVPTGLGSSIGDAMLNDQDMIIATDLLRLGGKIESSLTDRIIELNYGLEALAYAPTFGFELEVLLDRSKEIQNLKSGAEAGLRISLEQAYERTGFRPPRENEPYIAWVRAPATYGMPPDPGSSRIVYPPGTAPPPGDLALEPEESLELPGTKEVPAKPPPPPALPPSEGPSAPGAGEQAPPGNPGEAPGEVPGAAASTVAIPMPFAAPSGLSDTERESDD